jgi:hypothetical protein
MRKKRTKLISRRKIAVITIRQYLLDLRCLKFKQTLDKGGKALIISAFVVKEIRFMVSFFNKSNKRLLH